jgi:superfamily II DNA or RNA helicase
VRLVRYNARTYIERAPAWFLQYAARHLSVPIPSYDVADKGSRFGGSWLYQGPEGDVIMGSMVRDETVPAGLTDYVAKLAEHYRVPCSIVDVREPPEEQLPLWSVSMPWRPYQDEVQHRLIRNPVGIIAAPPRSGKTSMAARYLDMRNLPSVYIAPSVQIVRQTYEVFCRFFGEDFVARLDGAAKPHQRDVSRPFVVATAASAVRQEQEWWDTRRVLVIDEFHHSAAETYHQISEKARNAYYRVGLTGTHFRTGDDEMSMHAVISRVLLNIPIGYLVARGYLAKPRIFFLPVPRLGRSLYTGDVYRDGIVDHGPRNALVKKVALKLRDADEPTIILTRRRAHADYLADLIDGAEVVKGGQNALTSAVVKAFNAGDFPILVGTTVIGEGVDVPRASALIYASGGGAGVQQVQSYFRPFTAREGKLVGRVYDFADDAHHSLQRHARARAQMARRLLGPGAVRGGHR